MANYIIEYVQVGNVIKVSAADPITLKEAIIVVPAGRGIAKTDMAKLAIRRLEYVLKKG